MNNFDTQNPVWLWWTIPAGQQCSSSPRINTHTHIEYGQTDLHVNEPEYNYQLWLMLCNCCIISSLSINNLVSGCRNYRLIKSKGCVIYRSWFLTQIIAYPTSFSVFYMLNVITEPSNLLGIIWSCPFFTREGNCFN